MTDTSIEWTHRPGTKGLSWNPIRAFGPEGKVGWHCVHKNAACINCYAEAVNLRVGTGLSYVAQATPTIFLKENTLAAPLRLRAPRTAFVCSMTDLFGDWVQDEWLNRIFAVMALTPQHTYLVLTKRPERMRAYMSDSKTPFRIAERMDAMQTTADGPEELAPIASYPGYFASSHGFIYSNKRGKARKMSADAGEQGHLRVQLHREGQDDPRGDRLSVHRLVLETFVGPPPFPDAQGRHRDRNPANNAVSNLVWGDQEANWSDSKRHGTHQRYAKLSDAEVAEIRHRLAEGQSAYAIAPDFGISDTQVRNIRDGLQWAVSSPIEWPPLNCWLGVSVHDQGSADEFVPILLDTPAAKRWASYEPALEAADFRRIRSPEDFEGEPAYIDGFTGLPFFEENGKNHMLDGPALGALDWIVIGGESGPKARPFDVGWARSTIAQGKAAGIPVFVKQLGATPFSREKTPPFTSWAIVDGPEAYKRGPFYARLRDSKGGDINEFPEDLRVREWPR